MTKSKSRSKTPLCAQTSRFLHKFLKNARQKHTKGALYGVGLTFNAIYIFFFIIFTLFHTWLIGPIILNVQKTLKK